MSLAWAEAAFAISVHCVLSAADGQAPFACRCCAAVCVETMRVSSFSHGNEG